jgi:hypothetical protein
VGYKAKEGERKMIRRGLFIAGVILALSSTGVADPDPVPSDGDAGYLGPKVAALILWWAPDLMIVLGYPGPEATGEPESTAVAQSGHTVSTESAGPGTQSTYVSASHVSAVSGEGDAWADSEVVVVTSQSIP